MNLAGRLTDLASHIGAEFRACIRSGDPRLARAWVSFGWIDNTIQVASSYNVASVSRLSAGRYRVTFAAAFPDDNYCWLAFARSSSNSGVARVALARATSEAKTATYVEVACSSSSTSLGDTTEMNLVIYR